MLAFCMYSVVFYVPYRIGLPQFCRDQEREAERETYSASCASPCVRTTNLDLTREAFSSGTAASKEVRKKQTSRTIIRATWLRLLPGVHLWSIHQLVWLGS
jgi:hypothetical protein